MGQVRGRGYDETDISDTANSPKCNCRQNSLGRMQHRRGEVDAVRPGAAIDGPARVRGVGGEADAEMKGHVVSPP